MTVKLASLSVSWKSRDSPSARLGSALGSYLSAQTLLRKNRKMAG
jgi:hypothetical protein